tara:strand:+ start:411 stop:1412 length:1002 start_codon:yes stop_codon:yes gene_type:complete
MHHNQKICSFDKTSFMKKTSIIFFYLLILVVQVKSHGQYTEVINSNRPGFSQSAFSVGKQVVQFEIGSYIINENRTPYPSYEVEGFGIDFAARYGFLKESLEISINGNYQNDSQTYNLTIPVENSRANFKQLRLGAKYLIYDPNKNKEDVVNVYSYHANRGFKWNQLIPAVAISGGINYDTKNNPYTAGGVEGLSYNASVITQNNFYDGWAFVTNFLLDRISSGQQDFHYILTLTHALNEKWMVFAEKHGIKSNFYADNLISFGGGSLLNKDLQLDTGITFNFKNTPSLIKFSFGLSYRIDKHKDEIKVKNKKFEKSKRKKRFRSRKRSKNKA